MRNRTYVHRPPFVLAWFDRFRIAHSLFVPALLLTAGLIFPGNFARAANVLSNPGFETGDVTGWIKYGVFDINSTNNVYYNGCNCGSNVWVYDGNYVGKTYGQFTGGDNYNGVYQDVSAAPTAIFSADAWIYTSSQDRISGANVAWLEVHFLDASNNTIALYQSAQITPTTTPDTWMDYQITNQISPVAGTVSTLVAPSGTVKARFQIVFHQPPGYDGGSVFWDDADLNEISGPIPPSISNVYPDGKVLLQATNTLSFKVTGSTAITNVQVVLNGVNVSSNLVITGASTNETVSYPGLQTNKVNTVNISVTDSSGLLATATATFDTFDPNNFQWEAEDYDFNSGQFYDNPVLSSTPGANNYYQLVGAVNGVDYFDIQENDPANAHVYRAFDYMGIEATADTYRQKYLNAQATDPGVKDYDVGWFDNTEWCNYTRTFPAGVFNVYARVAAGQGQTQIQFAQITNGWGTATQALKNIGAFQFTGSSWTTYFWVPLTDINGNLAKLTLGGTNTFRATTSGGNNMQFFMLVPANTNLPSITAVYPNGATLLQNTNILSFTASSAAGINTDSIRVTLSVTNPLTRFTTILTSTNGLVITGPSTSRNVTYSGLAPNTLYGAVISVTDINNNTASTTVKFDTYNPVLTWEGEDWDYSGGQFIANPPADAYAGLTGFEGVDYHDVNNGGNHAYRPGDTMDADAAGDVPRQSFLTAGGTDYAVGYFSPPEWINYTRTIPSGTYNIYSRSATVGTSVCDLSLVTNGWGTASQQLQDLGNFTFTGNGWGTYTWVPLRDAFGNLVPVTLNSTNTFRVTRKSGSDANINFLMLLPAQTGLPTITQVTPSGFMQSGNELDFTVSDPAYGVTTNNIGVTINGVNVTGNVTFSGSNLVWNARYHALSPNTIYTAVISVTNNNGTVATTTVNFDTFSSEFTWEAEDYDYNGGHFFDNPQTNAYAGLSGVEGIDFHKTGVAGTRTYRPSDNVGTEACGDTPRPQYASSLQNYDMGFTAGGEWENYTRTYPTGTFNVYARMARGTSGTGKMGLKLVTGGWGTTNQTTTASLGSFAIGFSGGWQSYNWVPLTDSQGNLVNVSLGGTNTLRFTDGGANIDFFALEPARVLNASVGGGQSVLSFTSQPGFNYTVQYKNNLTDANWTPLNANSIPGDGSVKSVTDPAAVTQRFYRLQVH